MLSEKTSSNCSMLHTFQLSMSAGCLRNVTPLMRRSPAHCVSLWEKNGTYTFLYWQVGKRRKWKYTALHSVHASTIPVRLKITWRVHFVGSKNSLFFVWHCPQRLFDLQACKTLHICFVIGTKDFIHLSDFYDEHFPVLWNIFYLLVSSSITLIVHLRGQQNS